MDPAALPVSSLGFRASFAIEESQANKTLKCAVVVTFFKAIHRDGSVPADPKNFQHTLVTHSCFSGCLGIIAYQVFFLIPLEASHDHGFLQNSAYPKGPST